MTNVMRLFLPAFASVSLFTACDEQSRPSVEELRPVRYAQVYASGGVRQRTFSGIAKSGVEANLSFRVSGPVKELAVKVGDRVRQGQLIARLEPSNYELQAQQAEASLTQTKAQQQRAKSDYERIRGLYENKNAAKSDLDAARAAFESASASVEAVQKQLELARLQLSYTSLSAPVAGAIAAVNVETNENVQQGTPVVMLTSGGQIDVQVAIPEMLIAHIKRGDTATVRFDALPARSFDAEVTEVGVAATGFATTFPVTVRTADVDSQVRSGMVAEVAFSFATELPDEGIIVPMFAVGEDQDGRFVFVVEPADSGLATVRRVNVTIGDIQADGLEIVHGLADGDLIVTAGVSKIHDGQRVKI
jgi:RND family efflux transporter MFP subunit